MPSLACGDQRLIDWLVARLFGDFILARLVAFDAFADTRDGFLELIELKLVVSDPAERCHRIVDDLRGLLLELACLGKPCPGPLNCRPIDALFRRHNHALHIGRVRGVDDRNWTIRSVRARSIAASASISSSGEKVFPE